VLAASEALGESVAAAPSGLLGSAAPEERAVSVAPVARMRKAPEEREGKLDEAVPAVWAATEHQRPWAAPVVRAAPADLAVPAAPASAEQALAAVRALVELLVQRRLISMAAAVARAASGGPAA
jgi:hypothetical protein